MKPQNTSGLSISQFIESALKEDIGNGDHTSLATISEDMIGSAIIKVKQDGIICGLVVADQVFNLVDSSVKVKVQAADGDAVSNGQIVCIIEGPVRSILSGERLALNYMQRMSGIATLTRNYVNCLSGTNSKILDTRKTTPNFRVFEKWAVKAGGGMNHRFGLYDMILIKNNHVDAVGGIKQAIEAAREYLLKNDLNLAIEVETRNLKEVEEALSASGIDRIMLDNFSTSLLKEAVNIIDGTYETEASGGITLDNVREYALTGVDFISIGALTHSYKSLDISLNIQ
jgi:nicotinate-nucleotide pyrophosphorylase (carboxylating)